MGVLKLKYNSNNRNILKLKYIPTELIANRSSSFYVPEWMRFQNSSNIDFAKLNIKLKDGVRYNGCFNNCHNCTFDTKKMNLDKIHKDTTAIFKNNYNINIIGEIPSFNRYDNFFENFYWYDKTYDELKEISNKIANLEIIDGKLYAWQMFRYFPQDAEFYSFVDDEEDSYYFPLLDLSKWNVKTVQSDYGMFDEASIFRLKFYKPQNKIISYFINKPNKNFQSYFGIIENLDFENFRLLPYRNIFNPPNFFALYAENLGKNAEVDTYDFRFNYYWGTKGHNVQLKEYRYDEETGEESYITVDEITEDDIYNSFRYTVIEKSFDRKSANFTKCTIVLSPQTFNSLTDEEKLIITSKGYNVTYSTA